MIPALAYDARNQANKKKRLRETAAKRTAAIGGAKKSKAKVNAKKDNPLDIIKDNNKNAYTRLRSQIQLDVAKKKEAVHKQIDKLNENAKKKKQQTSSKNNAKTRAQKHGRYYPPSGSVTAEQPRTESNESEAEHELDTNAIADAMLRKLGGGSNVHNVSPDDTIPLNGSGVQYKDKKYTANPYAPGESWLMTSNPNDMTPDAKRKLDRWDPGIVQNKYHYPPVANFDTTVQMYRYNYYMDYDRDNLMADMDNLRNVINLDISGRRELFQLYTNAYNRFKFPTAGDAMQKTYGHVFFLRPDCNIVDYSGGEISLVDKIRDNANYNYAYYNSPELLRQLGLNTGYDSNFMMYLSNKALSFTIKDEGIGSDTYGKAFTGHKISYGKNNVEFKTAGDFSVTYSDDRDLHVFHLHKLWVDYISGVYRGEFNPRQEYMDNRELDYVTNAYYFLCAEDGETIIFWSKYYGVFPTSIPSSQYSWATGNVLSKAEYDVTYQYSFKEDFNPLSIIDFNIDAGNRSWDYIPIIAEKNYMVNTTWVGVPFVETFNNGSLAPYTFKLRFRKSTMTDTIKRNNNRLSASGGSNSYSGGSSSRRNSSNTVRKVQAITNRSSASSLKNTSNNPFKSNIIGKWSLNTSSGNKKKSVLRHRQSSGKTPRSKIPRIKK